MTTEQMDKAKKEEKQSDGKKKRRKPRESWKHFRHGNIEVFKLGNLAEKPKAAFSDFQKEKLLSPKESLINAPKPSMKIKSKINTVTPKRANTRSCKTALNQCKDIAIEKDKNLNLSNPSGETLVERAANKFHLTLNGNDNNPTYQISKSTEKDEVMKQSSSTSENTGRHNLPIRVTERRKSIAEPVNRVCNKLQVISQEEKNNVKLESSSSVNGPKKNIETKNEEKTTSKLTTTANKKKNPKKPTLKISRNFPKPPKLIKELSDQSIQSTTHDCSLNSLQKSNINFAHNPNEFNQAIIQENNLKMDNANKICDELQPLIQYQIVNAVNKAMGLPKIHEKTNHISELVQRNSYLQRQNGTCDHSNMPIFRFPGQPPYSQGNLLTPEQLNCYLLQRNEINRNVVPTTGEKGPYNNFEALYHHYPPPTDPSNPLFHSRMFAVPPVPKNTNPGILEDNIKNYYQNYQNRINNERIYQHERPYLMHRQPIQPPIDLSTQRNTLLNHYLRNDQFRGPRQRTGQEHLQQPPSNSIPGIHPHLLDHRIPSDPSFFQNSFNNRIPSNVNYRMYAPEQISPLKFNPDQISKNSRHNQSDISLMNSKFYQKCVRSPPPPPYPKKQMRLPAYPEFANCPPLRYKEVDDSLINDARKVTKEANLTCGFLTPPNSSLDAFDESELNRPLISTHIQNKPIPFTSTTTTERKQVDPTTSKIEVTKIPTSEKNILLNLSRNSVIKANFTKLNSVQKVNQQKSNEEEINRNNQIILSPTQTAKSSTDIRNVQLKETSTQTDLFSRNLQSKICEKVVETIKTQKRKPTHNDPTEINNKIIVLSPPTLNNENNETKTETVRRYENITPVHFSDKTSNTNESDNKKTSTITKDINNVCEIIVIPDETENDIPTAHSKGVATDVILIDDSSDETEKEIKDELKDVQPKIEKLTAQDELVSVKSDITFSKNSDISFSNILPPLNDHATLEPDEYVNEIKSLEKNETPSEFYDFYLFLTKKQILNNQKPISFKIFLEFQNAGSLKAMEEAYKIYMMKSEKEK